MSEMVESLLSSGLFNVEIPLPDVEYDEETQAFLEEYRKTRAENQKIMFEDVLIK